MPRQRMTTVRDTSTWIEIIELIVTMAVTIWCMLIEVQRANQPYLDQECSGIDWRCPRGLDTACSKIGCSLAHTPLKMYEDFFVPPCAKLRVYKFSSPDMPCLHRENRHLAGVRLLPSPQIQLGWNSIWIYENSSSYFLQVSAINIWILELPWKDNMYY